jgi:hypothetical protein
VPCGRLIIAGYRFPGAQRGFRYAGTGLKEQVTDMKRMMAIVIMLSLVLLATVAGAAAAPMKLAPPFRVVQFDVTYFNEVIGKLSVHTNDWKYVLNAHGLEPGEEYYFYCLGKFPQISNGTANENGDLHLKGAWREDVDIVMQTPAFAITDRPLLGITTPSYITANSCIPFLFRLKVWGTLYYKTESGNIGIPGQQITVYLYDKSTGEYTKVWGTATTDSNGKFSITQGSTTTHTPWVMFDGTAEWRGIGGPAVTLSGCPV